MISKLIWTGPRAELNVLDTLLSEVLFPPASAVSLIKSDPTRQDEESGWSLEAYFEDAPSETALAQLVEENGLSLTPPSPEDVPDQDWVAHSLEGLGAVTAGAFVLYGSHDADKLTDYKEIPILVEANRAFGTGHHPTTAGCLDAVSRLQDAAVETVLDVGTGSGVLAIAARKLFPNAVIVCTEIDPPSVDIARENAALNDAKDIEFHLSADLSPATPKGPYNLILANILAGPLIEMAEAITQQMAPGGTLILAGLLDEQKNKVEAAYQRCGLTVIRDTGTARWPVLTLSRSKGQ